ncbi:MAG: DNA mismatch repair endonuclease MutL [bacterium]
MGVVKLLPEKTINQIAAGEVVERPASIVKELIENSIDANAEKITVQIENGGKKKIVVKDDGNGMDESDVFTALERHATSKIKEISDLENISTMGFRGEAIPSIAAVTNFSISSATVHGEGFKVASRNGVITENRPVSIPKGTEIVCSNLFHNLPVRKKFLKSDEREFAHVKEAMQKLSIVNHTIAFFLSHNSRDILTLNSSPSHLNRIADVWKLKKEMIRSFKAERGDMNITAFVPSPFEQPVSLSVTAVNGRIINDRAVNGAIFRAFREQVGGDFKSPVALFIEVPKESVDINVHPSKLEVRFRDYFAVSELILNSIAGALKSFRIPLNGQEELEKVVGSYKPSLPSSREGSGSTSSVFDKMGEEFYKGEPIDYKSEIEGGAQNDNLFGLKIENYKKIGVIFGVYLVIEMEDQVIFLDQHASHERITFTNLKKVSEVKSGMSQMLIAPELVPLSEVEVDIVKSNIDEFSSAGFLIEIFDENSVAIRAVPAIGFETDWKKVVRQMALELRETGSPAAVKEIFLSRLATVACKSSVKRNDLLSSAEIDSLINDINNLEHLTCPHGRPFFFSISKNEFERRVKRQ